jgi:hypothetical protein
VGYRSHAGLAFGRLHSDDRRIDDDVSTYWRF